MKKDKKHNIGNSAVSVLMSLAFCCVSYVVLKVIEIRKNARKKY